MRKYEIRDETGELVAVHERIDLENGKRFVWRKPDGSVGLSVSTRDLPLYGIHRDLGSTVVLTEGEKAAEALWEIGVDAVATVCGAHTTPSSSVLSSLAGKIVVLWPDNDAVGIEHMRKIAQELVLLGIQVRWFDPKLLMLGEGADAYDATEIFTRESVLELLEKAATYEPSSFPEARFYKSGFRSFSLEAPDWRVTIRRVSSRKPDATAILEIYAKRQGFLDLGGLVCRRSISIYSELSIQRIAKDASEVTKTDQETWRRRIDYLIARAIENTQDTEQIVRVLNKPTRPDKIEWVLWGRLARGRTISLFGPGAAGKSTLADGIGLSLAAGKMILPGWVPSSVEKVMLLDWDEGEDEWLARTAAISAGHAALPEGRYLYMRMTDPLWQAVDDVGRAIVENDVTVLIVSPVNRAIRSSNEGRDPGAPIHELYEILRQLGTSNILIDHVNSGDFRSNEGVKEYGSIAKRDNARGSFSVTVLAEGIGWRDLKITNTKPAPMRPRIQPQIVRITFDPPDSPEGIYDKIVFSERYQEPELLRERETGTEGVDDDLPRGDLPF
jgi:hypothetical protein